MKEMQRNLTEIPTSANGSEAAHSNGSSNGHSHDHDHFVQLYDSDPFLVGSMARFMAPGLFGDDAAIVVATKPHRESLEHALTKAGCDLKAAAEQGRYVSLDAAEMLSRFMVDGTPDPMRFMDSIGGLVARTAPTGRRVRIFGEMVALLWADGNMTAAIELEKLWNDLANVHPFTLFCAYPVTVLPSEADIETFSKVADTHVRVLPTES